MILQGGGSQIGGVADSFHFLACQELMGGNIEMDVRVDLASFQGPAGAQGGLMLRESIREEAAFAALMVINPAIRKHVRRRSGWSWN